MKVDVLADGYMTTEEFSKSLHFILISFHFPLDCGCILTRLPGGRRFLISWQLEAFCGCFPRAEHCSGEGTVW